MWGKVVKEEETRDEGKRNLKKKKGREMKISI